MTSAQTYDHEDKTMWIKDDNGNRASVKFWGSEEKARESLATLVNCRDCTSCSGCTRCTSCSDCTHCSGCSRCSGCTRCTNCSGCTSCSDCTGCSYYYDDKVEVPVIADLHKRLYEAVTASTGALDMSQWHTCDTTHCRAGWVVTLAGEAGAKLERRFGSLLAAMKIYDASCPGFKIAPCRFFDSNEEALADIKRLAGVG